MFSFKVCIISTLLCFAMARSIDMSPSGRLNGIASRMDVDRDSKDKSDDYEEKMAEIFGFSLENDSRVNLENCQNIICMPHYLCINDMVVTNGTELFEWRISEKMVCGDFEMPCCADAAMRDFQKDSNEDQSKEIAVDDDDEDKNDVTNGGKVLNDGKCGYRKQQNTAHRIIDGDEAQPNEFPWLISIFFRLPSGNLRYIGGGSLIHESVVMTAAHFLLHLTPEQLVIRAGEHDIMDTTPNKKRQERNVTNIILHEHLDVYTLINDIGLIVLEKPFKLTDTVNTVCLPPPSVQTDKNVMCTTGGWGKNATDRRGEYQATLKKIELPIVERGKCEKILRKTRLGPYYNLDGSLMCAGGGKRDTCKGDGGSPLFCKIPRDNERFYQTGIVAGGIGCGRKIPGLYVYVAHFTNWISQQLGFIDLKLKPQNVLHYDLFD